jgi:hypothetical protein
MGERTLFRNGNVYNSTSLMKYKAGGVSGYAFILRALALLLAAEPVLAQLSQPKVERIEIVGNRTDEAVLRRCLPFSEGEPLPPDGLARARRALFAMRQFKSVDISSSAAPSGGAEVRIALEDGWFLIPFPFAAVGSGGSGGGLFLVEKNLFKESESISIAGFDGEAGYSGLAQYDWQGWSAQAAEVHRDYTERRYSNGSYSAVSGVRGPADASDPQQYGTIVDSYEKIGDETRVLFGAPLLRDDRYVPSVTAQVGWDGQRVGYENPSPLAPGDSGRQDQAVFALSAATSHVVQDTLGVIFGYGLADLQMRLQPLPAPRLDEGVSATYNDAGAWTGSEYEYSYEQVRSDTVLSWGSHRTLTLRVAGSHGDNLPPNRYLTTGRSDAGLQGDYAREFRGDDVLGVSLIYSHPFRTTTRGVWEGSVFAETARAWFDGQAWEKEGVGAAFWYRFWRFPIPIGFGTTYSIDDRNFQFSAAVGGRF